MCRLIGYTLFWGAMGMLIGMFIESIAVSIILILFLVMISYNLFVCGK